MRMNILRQVSKTSELQVGRLASREGEDLLEEDEKEDNPPTRKISTASLFNMVHTHTFTISPSDFLSSLSDPSSIIALF